MIIFDEKRTPPFKGGAYISKYEISEKAWKDFWIYIELTNQEEAFLKIHVSPWLANWWFDENCCQIALEFNKIYGQDNT